MKLPIYLFGCLFALFLLASCHNERLHITEKNKTEALLQFESARNHEAENDIRNALIYYWDALSLLDQVCDTIETAEVNLHLGDLLFRYGMYEKAVHHHRESFTLLNGRSDSDKVAEIAKRLYVDYTLLNQPDTASYYLDITGSLTGIAHQAEAKRTMQEHLNRIGTRALTDSIACVYDREMLWNLENRYKQEKIISARQKAQTEYYIRLSVLLALACVFLIVILILYMKKKKEESLRKEQFAWFDAIVRTNKEKLDEYQTRLLSEQSQIEDLKNEIRQNAASLRSQQELCDELRYFESKQDELIQKEKQLRRRDEQLLSADSMQAVLLINQLKSKPVYYPVFKESERKLLEEFADLLYDGFSGSFAGGQILSEREQSLCCLIRLGFTTAQLSIIYGISPGSVTKARFRLKKKLEEANIALELTA